MRWRPVPRSGLAIALVIAALSAIPGRARASASEQVPIGPRGIAMGGAYSSLADDATALFWNPAGLARIGHQELATSHANLYHSGIMDNVLSFALPISSEQVAATDWYSSGFDDGELGFGENRVSFGWGLRVRPGLWAGASGKWLSRKTSLDGFDLRSEQGLGADFGLLAAPLERLHLALVAQDAFGTRLRSPDGARQLAYPRNLRFGSSYAFRRAGTVAFDLDDRWHAGVELTPHPALALRLGTEADLHRVEANTWSYGVGLSAGYLHLDWAHVDPPVLEPTDHLAVSLQFNWNPSQVKIEKIQPRELYTSFYKSYSRQPFGTVTVRNLTDQTVTARMNVLIPEMMTAASEQEVILRPKVSQEVPLTAVMDERVITQRGDQPVQVRVELGYQSRRLERKERASMRTVAFAPGAIDWDLGMDQAAAYVTPRDPAVEALARAAGRMVTLRPRNEFGNRNVGFAAALTDALGELGVTYVPDPTTPFATVSGTPHAVDTINYPYETLTRRSGDCDDSTVLMASLLGNLGVESKFVDAPGHIFLVFDTGLNQRNRAALGVDTSLTVILDDGVWAPLETTAISKGFIEAWRIGAEEINKLGEHEQIRYWGVTEAQTRYEPALPPGERRIPVLDTLGMGKRLTAEAHDFGALRDAYFAANYGASGHDLEVTASALVEVASVNFMGGDMEGARAQLESALLKAPNSLAAHNDLGVVLASLGRLPEAEEHLRTAAALDGRNAGVMLNLGIAQCARGDSLAGRDALSRGTEIAGGLAAACALLGIAPADTLRRASEAAASASAEAWLGSQLRAALAAGPAASAHAASSRRHTLPPAGQGALAPVPAPVTITIPTGLDKHFHWIE